MAVIFEDEFENEFAPWDSTTITGSSLLEVQSAVKFHGNYAMHGKAFQSSEQAYCSKRVSAGNTLFFLAYLRFETLDDYAVMSLKDIDGKRIWRLRLGSDGELRLERWYPGYNLVKTGFVCEVGVWYPIEVGFVKDVAGAYRIWINDVEYTGMTNLDTTGAGDLGIIDLGVITTYATDVGVQEIYADYVVVADSKIGPIPAEHTIRIESNPISVPVTINGSSVGSTPVSLTVPEGSHTIEVPQEVTV